jgi:hypothetical protein
MKTNFFDENYNDYSVINYLFETRMISNLKISEPIKSILMDDIDKQLSCS